MSDNFPKNTPLTPAISEKLASLFSEMQIDEINWLREHLNALAKKTANKASELMVLYGTESGNAESLAEQTAEKANKLGFKAKISNMADISLATLKKVDNLLVIVSTWGEGDPPETAIEFYEAFMSDAAPKLDPINFSVLALGDTSYEHFCKIGKDFDSRLENLGGNRLFQRKDCDVDFDDEFAEWSDGALKAFSSVLTVDTSSNTASTQTQTAVKYSRKNPCQSDLSERINLNGTGSAKETMHLEFDLSDTGLTYEAGDSLAVQPKNSDELVNALLETTQFDPSTSVLIKEETYSLAEAFKSVLDITTLSIPFLTRYNGIANNQALADLLEDEDKSNIQSYINGRDLIDVLVDYPAKELNPQSLVDLLRKLPPRLYSIASSQKAHPDSVHLTVAVVRYETHGRKREGVCSSYLADRLDLDATADVFVTPNKNFKLPKNTDAPIIMVGPGTGIAPFRAFMQERKALGAKGKNWLFFGDQHFITDFLYQAEWQTYQKEGLLSKIDLAFSRDQKEKVYVQDKMLANARELFSWLESGAYFYVCGDASRMAHDVDKALHRIVQEQGSISEEDAVAYVKNMKKEKRYLRDVY